MYFLVHTNTRLAHKGVLVCLCILYSVNDSHRRSDISSLECSPEVVVVWLGLGVPVMLGLSVPVMLGLGCGGTGGGSVTSNDAALGLRFGDNASLLCVLDKID
jgi:hypothetical protein